MNSPYEDYYLEIIPYYNEDGMTPFSYIIPKSMEYFTATDGENDNNKSNNYAIAISDESSQSFKSDYKFLQDQNYLKSTFKSIIESDSFKQEYQKFETSTPFKTLFKTYITNFPKDSCSVSIFVNYSKTFVDNNLTSSVKEAFTTWWDANKSNSNNFILNTINNEKLQEPLEYFLNCFFFEDDAAKQVRKRLLCYIQKYISNKEYTDDNVLSYIQGFIDSLEYDSNGLKDITPCNCDETIDEATKQNMTSLIKTLQTVDAKSSSSTIWIIIAIVVVIIIIIVVVVIFMKKSKSKAVSATPANAVPTYTALADAASAAGRAIAEAAPTLANAAPTE